MVVAVPWFGAFLLLLDQDSLPSFDRAKNSDLYQEILQENVRTSIHELNLNRRNCRKTTALKISVSLQRMATAGERLHFGMAESDRTSGV